MFVELDVTAIRPSKLFEFLLKGLNAGFVLGIALGVRHHNPNAAHAICLLRAGRKRECDCCSADETNKFPPLHRPPRGS